MKTAFKQHIDTEFPFLRKKKLLVACSGGLDSVVLAHLIGDLSFEMGLAHCNFSLRGKESDGDEMFVIGMAKKMHVPVYAETFDTIPFARAEGISTQMAARVLRYNWFEEILKNFEYHYLLTAHHLDDSLETFLINLSRGSGIDGLCGIPPQNGNVVRPLLPFSREEILAYARKHNLEWREDSSNAHTDYLRNSIRLQVVPPLKSAAPSLLENFGKTQNHLRETRDLVQDYMALVYNLAVEKTSEKIYKIKIEKLKDLPNTKALLYELLKSFGFTEWNDVYHLLEAQSGKQLFSKTHRLLKDRQDLLLMEIQGENDNAEYTVGTGGISAPITLQIDLAKTIGQGGDQVGFFNAEKLQFPLLLRRWREGDFFYPRGMQGRKKVSKYFKDEKFSLAQKENTWLLLSGDNIIWVVGHRLDRRFEAKEDSNTIIRIAIK